MASVDNTTNPALGSAPSTSPIVPEVEAAVPVDAPAAGGQVLTVGPGEEFSDLWDAIANAHDDDVIAVDAGTYVDDSNSRQNGYVNAANVTIEGVGGMFQIVEPSGGQPYNQKAPIVGENGLTVKDMEVSGVTAHNLNGAGLRVDSGDLTVENSYFHDNQDGILGGADGDTITIDHCEFADNGQGGGGSAHNVYIGTVDGPTAAVLNFTNNLSISADTGHELKTRAAVNNISDNVIADLDGTSSYDIDICNGGATTIQDNLIEKGPDAENPNVISYGEENQFANPNSSLVVQDNTVLYDRADPYGPVLVNNQSQNALGTAIPVTVADDSVYGLGAGEILNGPGTVTGLTELASEPSIPLAAPFAGAPVIQPYDRTLTLDLDGSVKTAHEVSGGETGAVVTDDEGDVIDSGPVGISLVENSNGTITTDAGSVNTIAINETSTIVSQGTDTIDLDGGNYTTVTASGQTTINVAPSSWDSLTLNGQETVNAPGSASYSIGSAADVTLNNSCGSFDIAKPAGATLELNQVNGTVNSVPYWYDPTRGGNIAASGGAVSFHWNGYALSATASDGSPDSFVYDGGFAVVAGGTGADAYTVSGATAPGGSLEIQGFKQGTDTIVLDGTSVSSTADSGGNTVLTLASGTTVQVDGVSLTQADFGSTAASPSVAQGIVCDLYQGLLGGPPDTMDLASWSGLLTGGASAQAVVQGLLDSSEYQAASDTQFVTSLYNQLLDRAPDQPGLAAYVQDLRSGASQSQVAAWIALSPEAQQVWAGRTAGEDPSSAFITTLYEGLLGRDPVPSEVQGWLAAMAGGTTGTMVAQGFVGSPEYQAISDTRFVTSLYNGLLDRAPDQPGLAAYLQGLQSGLSQAQVATDIALSPEAQQVWGEQAAAMGVQEAEAGLVSAVYETALDRAPDFLGLQGWVSALSQGMTPEQFAQSIVGSPEYQDLHGNQSSYDLVMSFYRNGTGHATDPADTSNAVNLLQSGQASSASILLQVAQSPQAAAYWHSAS